MAESSTILKGAVSTSKANSKIKFIVGGLVIVGLIAYLIISSISSAGAYYREVGEVLAQQTALTGKSLRVSGNIVTDSVTYDAANLDLNFLISDPNGREQAVADLFPRREARPDHPRRLQRDRRRHTRRRAVTVAGEQPAPQVPVALRRVGLEEIKVEAVK